MKPAAFEYHSPETAEEATELLADLPDAKLMAGNQSFGIILGYVEFDGDDPNHTYQHVPRL
jgi:hypothetical protein